MTIVIHVDAEHNFTQRWYISLSSTVYCTDNYKFNLKMQLHLP